VPSGQALGQVFTRFETARQEIWLTIDDGPHEEDTPRLLDALDRFQAKATFFLIGERAARHPSLVAEILRRGHEVAHHTHTHPARTFWCAGPARVRRELDDALAAYARADAHPRRFRSPVGIKNFFLSGELKKRRLACIGWSVRSYDSTSRDPALVVKRVMAQLQPGRIVLMHEGDWLDARVRVRAVELLLAALQARNYACVLPAGEQLR
jgi:peptidoglycan/xylan/chitin deacetylase (PgdA/CDA1 family)